MEPQRPGLEGVDHGSDPHEWSNLAKDAKFAATKKKLGAFVPKNAGAKKN